MSERVIRQVSVIEKSDGSAVIERVDGHLDEVTATGTVLEIPAEDRAAVALALLAPEPEPSDAEIEAAMNVLFRDSICGFAGGLVSGRGNYTSSEHYRQLAEKTLAAARAARQTGGA